MKDVMLSLEMINQYQAYLTIEERSIATVKKYMRDVKKLYEFLPEPKILTKEAILQFKSSLENKYKATTINSILVAINRFLNYLDVNKLKVKLFKLQKRVFQDQNKVLSKKEYMSLLEVAKCQEDDRLFMLLQAICATGIRVSEHKAITVEALQCGKAEIYNKGKVREIYFDKKLKNILLKFCKRNSIVRGSIFITKKGKPIDRSNIWKMMKALCKDAKVDQEKVFPHNLRHLFAFTYYNLEKDLVKLAAILGHSSIETTKIYTMSSGLDCMKIFSKLGLLST